MNFGFATSETGIGAVDNSNTFQLPLYAPYNTSNFDGSDNMQWWYNLVEEAAFTNLQYLAMGCDGDRITGYGLRSPLHAVDAVQALDQRGYNTLIKLALFDDTTFYPHSYGLDNGEQNGATMDLSLQSNWATYWWKYKWKEFFDNVPDANRQKVDGRPLVFIWDVNLSGSWVFSHASSGHLKALIQYLKSQCQATYGFTPFVIVDQSWIALDPSVTSVIDGVDNWFNASVNNSWTKYSVTGASGPFTTGVVCPGFFSGNRGIGIPNLFLDRQSGNLVFTGLANTASANVILIENQTDFGENAGMYRGATDCESPATIAGTPPPAGQLWIVPNQYLDNLREFTEPYTKFIIFEAEACDAFYAPSSPNWGQYTPPQFGQPSSWRGLYRRAGNLNIQYTDSTQSNWAVYLNPTEWVQFTGIQLGASTDYKLEVWYGSTTGGTCSLLIDNVVVATNIALPATGSMLTPPGTYGIGMASGISVSAGFHNIVLRIDSGGPIAIDNFSLNGGP